MSVPRYIRERRFWRAPGLRERALPPKCLVGFNFFHQIVTLLLQSEMHMDWQ